ncbi:solute carrier family 17 member hypothetical protein [Limosa lapponica baueri]|uniref:Uncharacterized protein n=1 Tax=Limosa lapponica baueri TaxID=1758121 RepID=A0A2I0T9Z5_LIMLA|nr:solute carrier family 17 member hypothetical protein [Limosa lapponica baueri]
MLEVLPTAFLRTHGAEQTPELASRGSLAPRHITLPNSKLCQVIGSGVSSIFALCLGQTSSFCKAIVFASASVGLQTFNHSPSGAELRFEKGWKLQFPPQEPPGPARAQR